jgi:transcription-repair coupling factor (superfamily II helicase)
MDTLSAYFSQTSFPALTKLIANTPAVSLLSGCAGGGDAFLLADFFRGTGKTLYVSVENSKQSESLAEECASLVGEENVVLFPSRDAVPYNMKSPFGPVVEKRFSVLSQLLSGKKAIYIAPHAALLQKVLLPRELFNRIIRLSVGQDISIDTLSEWLVDNGFHRETMIQDVGAFSVRGGIVDVYPFMTDGPVRLEFFGDTIETIREFDVFTQKSTGTRKTVEIFPMKEFSFSPEAIIRGVASVEALSNKHPEYRSGGQKLIHQWKSMGDHEGIEWFLHHFGLSEACIIDYLPPDCVVFWNDILGPERRFDESIDNYERHLERVPEAYKPFVTPPTDILLKKEDALTSLSLFKTVYMGTAQEKRPDLLCQLDMLEQPSFPQAIEPLMADLTARNQQGFETIIVCGTEGHAQRLTELLNDTSVYVKIVIGILYHGFIDRANKRLVYTDAQLFGHQPSRQITHKKVRTGQDILSYDSLTPGDFVVHIDYGIGRFIGIERIETAGMSHDCMVIIYQNNAKLSVPVQDFHKVQKYIGKESIAPPISKLGSGAWERTMEKTRQSLLVMAQDLIQLYAKRQYLDGIAFSKDTLWQKEFEESFVYDETPDQLRAVAEIKKDMESKKPMDRLICGDVGFGKTEVAMRAAFKAVMDGYQVALLSPTTILTAQHYATMTQRMADFPVRIAMLSRFLSAKEQKEVVCRLQEGAVDILVGTHRILSSDITFKNLGLLIIDEEQRFGVRHKDKLKQFRSCVDVLSMTATPIPRTLHLSLVGARDLSIINTPPRNRLPIETKVLESHDDIFKQAIENELDRGGQVYVVENRIQSLDQVKDRIEQLVPRARVICAHGQMDETELERIMKEFVAGRYDVLVSTVIIENGLDIPNVNTIIVTRADALGLSQLYQLRGRVGRSSEQAYAYFLTPQFKAVSELALKRLRVLEQYTDLGSGFQIAMRDLEIRGAGNILGESQHGFIAAVGFELYCRLLEDAIKELRGEAKPVEKDVEISLDVPVQAVIPTDYLADPGTRIAVYQELAAAQTPEHIDTIEQSLQDRFGPLPASVAALLVIIRIKVSSKQLGCSKVGISHNALLLVFNGSNEQIRESMNRIFSKTKRQFQIENGPPPVLKTMLFAKQPHDQLLEARNILLELSGQKS